MNLYLVNSTWNPESSRILDDKLLNTQNFDMVFHLAKRIFEDLESDGKQFVKIYHSENNSSLSVGSIMYQILSNFHLTSQEDVVNISNFNSRDFGIGENYDKVQLKPAKLLSSKVGRSYLLANLNIPNGFGIEKKFDFSMRIKNGLEKILRDCKPDDNAILVVRDDVIRLCQQNDMLRRYFYFGDERTKGGDVSKSTKNINFGGFHKVEIVKPYVIGVGDNAKLFYIAQERLREAEQLQKQ